jgi:hypothetical protein
MSFRLQEMLLCLLDLQATVLQSQRVVLNELVRTLFLELAQLALRARCFEEKFCFERSVRE